MAVSDGRLKGWGEVPAGGAFEAWAGVCWPPAPEDTPETGWFSSLSFLWTLSLFLRLPCICEVWGREKEKNEGRKGRKNERRGGRGRGL